MSPRELAPSKAATGCLDLWWYCPTPTATGVDGGAWSERSRFQWGWLCPRSDTRLNYTRPGFDDDTAVLVVGDVDPHLGVDLGLVRRVVGQPALR